MTIEALIRLGDEPSVEASLADTRLVARNEKDGPTLGIEGEGNPSDAVRGIAAQFLHVRVLRSGERIRIRSSEPRPLAFQKLRTGQNDVLNRFRITIELVLESVEERDRPFHVEI